MLSKLMQPEPAASAPRKIRSPDEAEAHRKRKEDKRLELQEKEGTNFLRRQKSGSPRRPQKIKPLIDINEMGKGK